MENFKKIGKTSFNTDAIKEMSLDEFLETYPKLTKEHYVELGGKIAKRKKKENTEENREV